MKVVLILFSIFFTISFGALTQNRLFINWDNVKPSDIHLEKYLSSNWKNFEIEGRITGGTAATPHEYPYQVGLLLFSKPPEYPQGATFWCGGTLLSRRVVLTAAHCVKYVKKVSVMLGVQNIQDNIEPDRVVFQLHKSDVIIHEDYDIKTHQNDIALIILPNYAPLSKSIQTAILPREIDYQHAFEGRLGIVTGWGVMGDNSESPNILQAVNLRILSGVECSTAYSEFYDKESQICISGQNQRSACSGDSGGPLVIRNALEENIVIGLVSFGRVEGCQKGFPSVFTRVTKYLDWIKEKSEPYT